MAVVGATGLAGQQLVAALQAHPHFEIRALVASRRSAGKTYREALRDARGAQRWHAAGPFPEALAEVVVEESSAFDPRQVGLVFTAVDGAIARELEARYAAETPVVSTTSAFRMDEDVPLLIPPVNAEHAALLRQQRERRGWRGFVAPIPNCTTTGLAISLAPLAEAFGVRRVWMTSLQAVSGAGRSPGVVALDVVDNVVPYIPNEEEKVEAETRKILGALSGVGVDPHPARISATCTRVAVLDGHTESVVVELERPATASEAAEAMRAFRGHAASASLPSAPRSWLEVHEDPYRPQPRLDREAGGGMSTSVGRLREDSALDNGLKYVLVSHNTMMGAGKGAVLVAELLREQGLL